MVEQTCLYINDCRQDKRGMCFTDNFRCIVYHRFKILDRNKSKTGLERFMEKYPEWPELFIGSSI